MKTLLDLKNQVKRYLMSNTTLMNVVPGQTADATALTAEIDAAITHAANNARRFAEMRHDFSATFMTGFVTFTGGTASSLDAVPIDEEAIPATRNFRMLEGLFVRVDDTMYPIKVVSRRTRAITLFRQQDLEIYSTEGGYMGFMHGRTFTIEPVTTGDTLSIAVSGSVWMPDYTDNTDTDWFLDNGFEFMQWASICELNHMLLKFVPRQEGTLSPPVQARDIALESLIINDSYSIDGGIYHDL